MLATVGIHQDDVWFPVNEWFSLLGVSGWTVAGKKQKDRKNDREEAFLYHVVGF
jgi:hypothetical protein